MACANCGKDGQSMTPPENNGQPMYIGGAAQGTPVRTDPDLPPTFDGGTLPTVTVTAPRPDWQKTGIPKLVKEGNFDKHFGLPMRYSSDEDNAYADRIKYEYAPGLEHLSATVLGTALSGALGEMSLVVGAATSAETGTIIGLGIERDLASHSVGVITWKNAGWQQAGLTRVDWGRALMDNYSFRESFYQAVERASAIRFNVTNFNPIYANPGMTNMEFNHIINNPSLLQKTTFISDGVHVFWDGVKLGIK